MTVIVDTSGLLALYDEDQDGHSATASFVADTAEVLVVSPMVVAEADYMLDTRLGARAAQTFARDIVSGAFELAAWTLADHASAVEVVEAFDGKDYLGITDASNVVVADRYRTTTLLTLDHRHFRLLQPIWGARHFTLVPDDL